MMRHAKGSDLWFDIIHGNADLETLRMIRNECRAGFANDNAEITKCAQRKWWRTMRGKVWGYLYWIGDGHTRNVVGYGLLRMGNFDNGEDENVPYSSVAVLPKYSGKGYGGFITAHLIRQSPMTVHAAALKSNPAACALHREEDWEIVGEDTNCFYYQTRDDILSRPQRELIDV